MAHVSENNKLRRDNAALREALATGKQLLEFLLEQEDADTIMLILGAIRDGHCIAYSELCSATEIQALPFRAPTLATVISLAPPPKVTGPKEFTYP